MIPKHFPPAQFASTNTSSLPNLLQRIPPSQFASQSEPAINDTTDIGVGRTPSRRQYVLFLLHQRLGIHGGIDMNAPGNQLIMAVDTP